MINSFKSILCLALSALMLLSLASCKKEAPESSQSPTSVAPTTQPIPATKDEVASEPKKYNHNKVKQNSDKIKTTLDNIIASNAFKGTVYLKIGNDFEYVEAEGFSNKDTHTDNAVDTRYRLGSITKQFTAAAIMLLQEQGALSVNDTLDKYYPSYKHSKSITIKNLLNMTSGLPDYMCMDGSVDSFFIKETQLGYNVSSKNSAKENKNAIMEWIFAQELNFEAGTQYQYSNSGYYLLGDIIERVSSVSYEKFIQQSFIEPLGLESTGFIADERLSKSYNDTADYAWTLYSGVGYSSMGLISNVTDLLIWAEAFSDDMILSEASVKEMTNVENGEYGYGFFVIDSDLSQNGRIEKYGANYVYSKSGEVIFIALSNYANSDAVDLYSDFANALKIYQ